MGTLLRSKIKNLLPLFIICFPLFYGGKPIFSQSNTFNKKLILIDSTISESASQIIEIDQGYILYGKSEADKPKLVITKLDKAGEIIWLKSYGNDTRYFEPGIYSSMIKTSDSNFALAVSLTDKSITNSSRIMLLKFDQNGDTLWSKQVYTPDSVNYFCTAYGVIETFDTGYLVYGREDIMGVMIKTDSLGNKEWITHYGTNEITNYTQIFSVKQTIDSGYMVGGHKGNLLDDQSGDPVVVRYDKFGIQKWEKGFGSLYSDYPRTFLQPAGDSNYMVLTHFTTETSGPPYWEPQKSKIQIININLNGDITLNVLKGDEQYHLYAEDLDVMKDGSFIACGTNPYLDISWMYRFSCDRDSLYFRLQGPPGKSDTIRDFNDIKYCSDTGIITCGFFIDIIGGNYVPKAWLLKTDQYGCLEMGCDPNGIYILHQPSLAITCKNQQTMLHLDAYNSNNNINYTWQSYHGGLWQNLDDSTIYQGLHDDTLIINSKYIESNKEYYRCNFYNTIWSFYTDSVWVDFIDTVGILSQPENQTVQLFGSAIFKVEVMGETPINYQWFHNSEILNDETDSLIQINYVTLNDTGLYYCLITNECGSIESEKAHLGISNLGIPDNAQDINIWVTPNPTGKLLFVLSDQMVYIESLKLVDQFGRTFFDLNIDRTEKLNHFFDLSNLSGGYYLLIIQTDKQQISKKVLKL